MWITYKGFPGSGGRVEYRGYTFDKDKPVECRNIEVAYNLSKNRDFKIDFDNPSKPEPAQPQRDKLKLPSKAA